MFSLWITESLIYICTKNKQNLTHFPLTSKAGYSSQRCLETLRISPKFGYLGSDKLWVALIIFEIVHWQSLCCSEELMVISFFLSKAFNSGSVYITNSGVSTVSLRFLARWKCDGVSSSSDAYGLLLFEDEGTNTFDRAGVVVNFNWVSDVGVVWRVFLNKRNNKFHITFL